MSDPVVVGRSGAESKFIAVFTTVLLAWLLLPIGMVLVMGFTSATTMQFPPPSLSLKWYADVWSMLADTQDDFTRLKDSILTSVAIATLTSVICLLVGVPASYALVRYKFRGRGLVEEFMLSVPIVFPTVVLGVSLLVFVSMSGVDLGIFQIVIAHSIIGLPFMMRNTVAALHGIDPSLQEAAKTLGASSVRAFAEVILPLIRGGMSAGMLLVFILSFNEFTLSFFLFTIDVYPLSIWLFTQSETEFSPAIFAVSSLMIVLNIAVILIIDKAFGVRGAAH